MGIHDDILQPLSENLVLVIAFPWYISDSDFGIDNAMSLKSNSKWICILKVLNHLRWIFTHFDWRFLSITLDVTILTFCTFRNLSISVNGVSDVKWCLKTCDFNFQETWKLLYTSSKVKCVTALFNNSYSWCGSDEVDL